MLMLKTRARLLLFLLAIALYPLAAASSGKPDLQFLHFKSYVLVYRALGQDQYIEEYTPVGQDTTNWEEMFTWQYFPFWTGSPQDIMEGIRNTQITRTPKARWKVHYRQKDSVIYEWRISDDPDFGDRLVIGRIQAGEVGIHMFLYETKRLDISSRKKSGWIDSLRGIELADR